MSELERKLLRRMSTSEAISEAFDAGVTPELFEEPLYQSIFAFVLDYWHSSAQKSAPTPWALTEKFPGYVALADADEEVFYLAEMLRKRFVTNQLQEMLRVAADNSVTDPIATLKLLHATAYNASEAVAPRVTRTNMAYTVQERRTEYERYQDYPQGIGVPYGLDLVDLHTGGLQPGELAILGGFAKTGKTMLGLHVCAAAVRQGYRPLVYTLEMGLKEITTRLDAMFSRVSYDRLSHRRLSDAEKDQLWAAQDELASLGGIQIERPDEGDRTVASLLARARQYGADYLFIDQLSHMEAGHSTQTLKEHHGSILKQLGNEISRGGSEIPCLLATQLRRGDEEVSMESFANASETEREADILLAISRNQDLRSNGLMRFEILGSRRSDTGAWLLNWELTTSTNISVQKRIPGT